MRNKSTPDSTHELQRIRRVLGRIADALELQALLAWDHLDEIVPRSKQAFHLAARIKMREQWHNKLLRGYLTSSAAYERTREMTVPAEVRQLKNGTWVCLTRMKQGPDHLWGDRGTACTIFEALEAGLLERKDT